MGLMLQNIAAQSRRYNSRILTTTQVVWACWYCNGREDVSRVRDLSLGGLFLETAALRAIGPPTKVDFLVGEGQIRADAVVPHIVAGRGMGVEIIAANAQGRLQFGLPPPRLGHRRLCSANANADV